MPLRSVAVCITDHDGKTCFKRSVRSDVPDVLLCLAALGQPIHQVGFEAGALTQPITYGLVEAGYDVVCTEARQVAAALSAIQLQAGDGTSLRPETACFRPRAAFVCRLTSPYPDRGRSGRSLNEE